MPESVRWSMPPVWLWWVWSKSFTISLESIGSSGSWCGQPKRNGPILAILTDSPDFNFRVANKLHGLGIPVIYLIAPQVWAWREGRVRQMRRNLARVLCIFPFEEAYFEGHGVPATYIGHPLTWTVSGLHHESGVFPQTQH